MATYLHSYTVTSHLKSEIRQHVERRHIEASERVIAAGAQKLHPSGKLLNQLYQA